ncbi:Gfo/Idh/MocA family oxidoreductase [Ruminococcaceae bacterium OttesenSCG-928-I18]|nr:Gfo/Idh/MocA family oxidoreductase [Ruminococcaceae bacterium OttesenSCG-928-I18]
MKLGIFGPGVIAREMAKTISQMDHVVPYAVASRSKERAEAFAAEFGFEKSYGSYQALAEDEGVDLVYIATPHSHHAVQAEMLLGNHRPVLCEKAFTVNAAQAGNVLALSAEKNVFITEAIWPRYMPMAKLLRELLEDGVIGRPTCMTVNFGGPLKHIQRMYDPNLAGGALLDLGVYPLTLASIAFGDEIEQISTSATLLDSGVDGMENICLHYKDGKIATLLAGFYNEFENKAVIFGEEGRIEVEGINNYQSFRVLKPDGTEKALHLAPPQITGYEYEVQACYDALQEGRRECPEMPHSETLFMMELMDKIRAVWGVRYPFE